MKHIDQVRGFHRNILFEHEGGYKTSAGDSLTNCVVEVVGMDWQGHCPVISLRFYHKPYPGKLARESAEQGYPLYDEDTEIGVEINLGPEMAQSLYEQLGAKLPEFLQAVQAEPDAE